MGSFLQAVTNISCVVSSHSLRSCSKYTYLSIRFNVLKCATHVVLFAVGSNCCFGCFCFCSSPFSYIGTEGGSGGGGGGVIVEASLVEVVVGLVGVVEVGVVEVGAVGVGVVGVGVVVVAIGFGTRAG